eukprot:TRINITY_DN20231_c0_g1_i1.p1 TRINITY_DN20231_c0_g1~~TRINITY_DN20231_c0_g1_i1.p1  ORF type:complete len:128 (+),score=23.00 TRINITY_DN20231_c0_g1_i1:60-386(+)
MCIRDRGMRGTAPMKPMTTPALERPKQSSLQSRPHRNNIGSELFLPALENLSMKFKSPQLREMNRNLLLNLRTSNGVRKLPFPGDGIRSPTLLITPRNQRRTRQGFKS